MTYDVGDKEFAAILRLPGPARYTHLVKKAADTRTLWGLRGAMGWVQATDDFGRALFPVWPHARYAQACALGHWAEAAPAAIDLEEWRDRWTPELVRHGRLISCFPAPEGNGAAVPPDRLAADLARELEEWYGENDEAPDA